MLPHDFIFAPEPRAEFPKEVVAELIQEADGKCQCGCGRPDNETHHVMPRTRGGRGVKTNAMRINGICNQRFHDNEEELQYWISEWEIKFGPRFWFGAQDWEEYDRKQSLALEAERDKQAKEDQLEPIVNLLAIAAGRALKAKEMRLIGAMNDKEITVFAKLMQDVIGSGLNQPQHFGYGHFED